MNLICVDSVHMAPGARLCRFLVACTSALLLFWCGCSSQLRRVPRDSLATVADDARPQRVSATVPAGYTIEVLAKGEWKAYASTDGASSAIDGDVTTALTTPAEHGKDVWVLVDLGDTHRLHGVRQIHGATGGPAVRYRIDVAGPEGFPWELVWVGTGSAELSGAVFGTAVDARFLRITVLEELEPRWAVAELEFF